MQNWNDDLFCFISWPCNANVVYRPVYFNDFIWCEAMWDSRLKVQLVKPANVAMARTIMCLSAVLAIHHCVLLAHFKCIFRQRFQTLYTFWVLLITKYKLQPCLGMGMVMDEHLLEPTKWLRINNGKSYLNNRSFWHQVMLYG